MAKNANVLVTLLAVAALLSACGGQKEAELLAAAKASLDKKDDKAAVIQLKGVLQKAPSSAEARFLLGTALLATGDAVGADVELRRARELQYPDEKLVPALAQAMLATRQYPKLIAQLGAVQLSLPQNVVTLQVALAGAFAAQGAMGDARAALGRALAADPQSAPALIAQARLQVAGGDVEAALAGLNQLLAARPDSAEAWQLHGDLTLRYKNNLVAAGDSYRKALAVQPDLVPAHAALITLSYLRQDETAAKRQIDALNAAAPGHPLTRLYEAQKAFAAADYKRANDLLQPMVAALPDNVSLLFLAAATELQLNALSQAERHLQKAVQLQPQFAAAQRLLAKVYLRAGQPAKAVASLRPLLDKEGADVETLTIGGQAQLLAGNAAAANALFTRAASLKPADAPARTALAVAQLGRGNGDTAFNELQSIAAADSGTAADMALISARLQRNQLDAALKAIEALERKQPDNAAAADLRGRVHLLRKEPAAARQSFEQAVRRDPRYFPAVSNLAALDFLEKKPEAAKARFEALLKLEPKNVQALLSLADLARYGGATRAEIAKWIDAAIQADPGDPQPRLVLIDLLVAASDSKAALAAAQKAAAAVPASIEIQARLGSALLAAGDVNQAIATFGRLANEHADAPLGHLGLAEASLVKKDFVAAGKSAQRALELEPGSLAAQRLAIFAAMGQRKPQDALRVARNVQVQRPKEALGFLLQGEIEAEQKHWPAAVAAFRAAVAQASPAQAPARLHFALLQADMGAEAARFAESWQSQHPKDTLFVLYLADAASVRGDLAVAEQHYLHVLKQQPDNSLALNNLAWVSIKQKKPGAVGFAERAVKAAPGRSAYVDTLASALSSDGQHAKAIEMQKQLVDSAPDAPAYRLTLAKIYLQSGDKGKARTQLELLSNTRFSGQTEVAELRKSAAL